MGDPACWLHQLCVDCARLTDDLDRDGRCVDCASAPAVEDETATDPDAGETR